MTKKHLINKNLEAFYNKVSEEKRLEKGMGIFEFERVKTLIGKHLNSKKMTIADIGGGTGKYASWLAQKGHKVILIEPLEKHLDFARKRARKTHGFNIIQGIAQNTTLPFNTVDLVIMHGPLYHLPKLEDRLEAIKEAKRILRKDGQILGFAINHSANMMAGLINGLMHKASFIDICIQEIMNGSHEENIDFPWLMPCSFFHSPNKLKEEFSQCGLSELKLVPVEGPVWLDKDFFRSIQDKRKKANLIKLIHAVENDESLLTLSPHFMISAKK